MDAIVLTHTHTHAMHTHLYDVSHLHDGVGELLQAGGQEAIGCASAPVFQQVY